MDDGTGAMQKNIGDSSCFIRFKKFRRHTLVVDKTDQQSGRVPDGKGSTLPLLPHAGEGESTIFLLGWIRCCCLAAVL
jgi:hypothetical protein